MPAQIGAVTRGSLQQKRWPAIDWPLWPHGPFEASINLGSWWDLDHIKTQQHWNEESCGHRIRQNNSMDLNCMNCIGCGAPVSGAFKLCPRCCRLLGVRNSGKDSINGPSPLPTSCPKLPSIDDRGFLLGFSILTICSVVTLGWLGLAIFTSETDNLNFLMKCLCWPDFLAMWLNSCKELYFYEEICYYQLSIALRPRTISIWLRTFPQARRESCCT